MTALLKALESPECWDHVLLLIMNPYNNPWFMLVRFLREGPLDSLRMGLATRKAK